MGCEKINFVDVLEMLANLLNNFLVSSVLACLYVISKVLGQIWGPFFPGRPGRGYGESFLWLWVKQVCRSR